MSDPFMTNSANPAISVFIPTYNRVDALIECLRHLANQTFTDFEAIIVDDGSTDATEQRVREFVATATYPILYLRQPHRGPGPARNFGLRHVRSPLVLYIGDDIWASPTLVERHILGHQQHRGENEGILGLSRFVNPNGRVTKFERWLENEGAQFAYGQINDGDRLDWRFFHTSNLSLKTSLLHRYPSPENFPPGAFADIELGYRISRNGGLSITYDASAAADHYHPTSFAASCRRMHRVGTAAQVMIALHPELTPKFLITGSPLRMAFYRWAAGKHSFVRFCQSLMEKTTDFPMMRYLWAKVMRLSYFAGQESLPQPGREMLG
jgi:glycosyltransferase involved in cell wall biosynthesis